MHSNIIEHAKQSLALSKRQREILVGLLLGDGHLEIQNQGRTYRLKIEHSLTQRDYVDWLYHEFSDWVLTGPQEKTQQVTWKNHEARTYQKYWFNTVSVGSFRFYAQQFYQAKKKRIPRLIHKWITPCALAVWYMDDGAIKSNAHRIVLFNTQGFLKEDLVRLQGVLKKKFGIITTLRAQKEGWQIYVTSEGVAPFRTCVEPFILPSMRYKLPKIWLTKIA